MPHPTRVQLASHMDLDPQWAYFDHAAVSPLPVPTREALISWATNVSHKGCIEWPHWRKKLEDLRFTASELLGSLPSEIALVRSTTEGINFVVEGYPWKPGDNVVLPENEFASNLLPWLNLKSRDVDVRLVKVHEGRLNPADIDAACDSHTRIVSASWVSFSSGYRIDPAQLAEIAHQHGALFFLDAIQGLGMFPLNVHDCDIDFLAADGHKWLLGPEGAGIFYLKHHLLDLLKPLGIGWNSIQSSGSFDTPELILKTNADRYEGGTFNMPGFQALNASLHLFQDLGIDNISHALREVTQELVEILLTLGGDITADRSDAHWSGIVPVKFPHKPSMEVKHKLFERQIQNSVRMGCLRFSPHAYTPHTSLTQLNSALRKILSDHSASH